MTMLKLSDESDDLNLKAMICMFRYMALHTRNSLYRTRSRRCSLRWTLRLQGGPRPHQLSCTDSVHRFSSTGSGLVLVLDPVLLQQPVDSFHRFAFDALLDLGGGPVWVSVLPGKCDIFYSFWKTVINIFFAEKDRLSLL